MDRLTMLKKLSFIGENNINIFSSYIPDHYDEIYSLYDLFKKTSLDYDKIEFWKPVENEQSFTFICSLPDDYFKILEEYLEDNKSVIQYKRNKPFKIALKIGKDEKVHIKFKKGIIGG